MAIHHLTRDNLALFKDRFNKIVPDAAPKFGTLPPAGMFRHLQTILEMSLGQSSHPDISNWFTRNIVRPLVFDIITRWPGGKLKAPDSFTPAAQGDYEAEKVRLFQLMEEFTRLAQDHPEMKTNHALFGPVELSDWQKMHGVHFEHHFRQFGV